MEATSSAHAEPNSHATRSISVAWVVLAALMIGIGLGLIAYWQLTQSWLYFAGIIPTILGGMMLFSRRAGLDHA
jgi:uncharacterized membrane protein